MQFITLISKSLFVSTIFYGSLFSAPATKAKVAKATAESPAYYWYYYNLDTTGQYNGESRIRFDSKGNLKVGFQGKYVAKYAQLIDNVVKVEVADTSFTAGGAKLDMSLDKDGNPHMIYHRWNYTAINYCWHDGKKWNHLDYGPLRLDLLDFYQLGIEMDSKGSAHIAYPVSGKDYYFPSLAYIRVDKDGSSTTPVLLGGSSLQGKYVSVALDEKEQPLVSHYTFDGANLTLSYLDGVDWKYQVIDSSQFLRDKGHLNSMAVLGGGKMIIATENHKQFQIQIAIGTPGGEWKIENLDTLIGYTHSSSKNPIAVDADGIAYVAYPRLTNIKDSVVTSKLMLATRKDTTWNIEVVDSTELVGEFASIAVNPVTKLPGIVYFDRKNNHLKLAVARKEAPSDTNNNGVFDYQEPASIKRMRQGRKWGTGIKKTSEVDAIGREQKTSSKILFIKPTTVFP